MTPEPAVACRGLTRRYGTVLALDDLDLAIEPGTIYGLLGPNGAGKTTTLRLLTGLARPTAGSVSVAGVDPRTRTAGPRPFGYLDQDPRFYGWMRGSELLGLVADLHRLDPATRRSRIGEALEVVGLADAASRRIGGYSGGMRQRLGLAAALLPRPSVLLLDEPVSALDPAGRHDILGVIAALRGTTTVLMSTHILNDVERVCDRVAILDHGRLLSDAPIAELLERYASPVIRVEGDVGADLGPLAARLREQAWVTGVSAAGDELRVVVTDPVATFAPLLALVAASGVPIAVVERQRPTLEEVFLRIVDGGEPA